MWKVIREWSEDYPEMGVFPTSTKAFSAVQAEIGMRIPLGALVVDTDGVWHIVCEGLDYTITEVDEDD